MRKVMLEQKGKKYYTACARNFHSDATYLSTAGEWCK